MTLQFNLMKIIENVSNFFALYLLRSSEQNSKMAKLRKFSDKTTKCTKCYENRWIDFGERFQILGHIKTCPHFLLTGRRWGKENSVKLSPLNFFQQRFQTFSKALLFQLLTALLICLRVGPVLPYENQHGH